MRFAVFTHIPFHMKSRVDFSEAQQSGPACRTYHLATQKSFPIGGGRPAGPERQELSFPLRPDGSSRKALYVFF